jgi:glutamate-1-semialdehyde aminotransferase
MTRSISSKSAALYERARRVLPDGVSRNTVLFEGPPIYAHRGKGCGMSAIG